MAFYFMIFCGIGFAVGMLKNIKVATIIILVITLCWGLIAGPWAFATFIELILGCAVARLITHTQSSERSASTITSPHTQRDSAAKKLIGQIPPSDRSASTPQQQAFPQKNKLPENFILTEEFIQGFELLENTEKNIFITGRAGTGKSTLLTYFRQETKKNVIILAPTGVAALNVEGATIHSFFRFPTRLLEQNDNDIQVAPQRRELFKKLRTVVIDEISMVRADLLDAIDYSLRIARNDERPFGGVQMVFFGDVFQLPPVVTGKDLSDYFEVNYGGPYFFNSKSFASSSFVCVELSTIFRQKDDSFKNILNCIRENRLGGKEWAVLNAQFCTEKKADGSNVVLTLCATNKIATEINDSRMAALPTKELVYHAEVKGKIDKSAYPTEPHLVLKDGAQIMMLKNDPMKRWGNGTLGVIKALTETSIEVSIDNVTYSVDKTSWEVIDYQYNKKDNKIDTVVTGSFTQYPLKPAWAITIHKSQGQTFDRVNIHLGNGAFTHGQTYVALSRCTSLSGITLKTKIRPKDVIVDPKVSRFASQHIKQIQYPATKNTNEAKAAPKATTEKYSLSNGGEKIPNLTPGAKTYTNSIGMKFVLIPAGSFQRDAGNEENPIPNELEVTVSKPFYLGIYPVTQKQWEAVMGSIPAGVIGRKRWDYENMTSLSTPEDSWQAWKKAAGLTNPSWFLGEDNPVDSVPWEDAQEFINRLNTIENHQHYRLPTNMEWELAAMAGTDSKFFLGEDEALMGDYAWVPNNADDITHPVGQKKPNPYGLYDIYGNVSEWVQDWHGDLPTGEVRDYTGPSSGEHRISRGGRTLSGDEFCAINDLNPKYWHYLQGFRVALSAEATLPTGLATVLTLKDLPEELREPNFYLTAVHLNGKALASIPKMLRTPELCLAAVQSNGSALRFVPEYLKTQELCMAAVQADESALEYVSERLKTSEFLGAVSSLKFEHNDDSISEDDDWEIWGENIDDSTPDGNEWPLQSDNGDMWEVSDDLIPYCDFGDEKDNTRKKSSNGLKEIIQEIEARKIKYLVHFTNVANLESILTHGFIPRSDLENTGTTFEFNDQERRDGRKDCTCFSLEYPNEFFMRRYRNKNLCVLRLNIKQIVEFHDGKIFYTMHNAAIKMCRDRLNSNPESLSTYNAFINMFKEENPDTRYPYTRTEKGIKKYLPTNHQSEVLISGKLNPEYIEGIFFHSKEDLDTFIRDMENVILLSRFSFVCDDFYFKSRDDCEWRDR